MMSHPRRRTRIGNADVNYVPHGVYRVVGEDNWLAIACEEDSQWVYASRAIELITCLLSV